MNSLSYVRPLLRVIGVFLIGLGLPETVRWVGELAFGIENGYYSTTALGIVHIVSSSAACFTQILFGLYLLCAGNYIARLCVRETYGLCVRCGYDVSSDEVFTCPECGLAVPDRLPAMPSSVGSETAPPSAN